MPKRATLPPPAPAFAPLIIQRAAAASDGGGGGRNGKGGKGGKGGGTNWVDLARKYMSTDKGCAFATIARIIGVRPETVLEGIVQSVEGDLSKFDDEVTIFAYLSGATGFQPVGPYQDLDALLGNEGEGIYIVCVGAGSEKHMLGFDKDRRDEVTVLSDTAARGGRGDPLRLWKGLPLAGAWKYQPS